MTTNTLSNEPSANLPVEGKTDASTLEFLAVGTIPRSHQSRNESKPPAGSDHGSSAPAGSSNEAQDDSAGTELEPRRNPLPGREQVPYALVMKGGGAKGLAYLGALAELTKYYKFDWYLGTSAGAISAILLAADYGIPELTALLEAKDFRDFRDAGPLKAIFNLALKDGLYNAETLTKWLDDLLARKLRSSTRVRMEGLSTRATVYACKRDRSVLIFDSIDPESRKTAAAYAVRCSAAIPFVFVPEKHEGMRVLDGGLRQNYPIKQLLSTDPNKPFIGLYLGPETYEGEANTSIIKDLLAIFTEAPDADALRKYRNETIIIDPRPISTLDFKLSPEEKQFLLLQGRSSALQFLSKQSASGISAEMAIEAKRKASAAKEVVNRQRLRRRIRRSAMAALGFGALLAGVLINSYLRNRCPGPLHLLIISHKSQANPFMNGTMELVEIEGANGEDLSGSGVEPDAAAIGHIEVRCAYPVDSKKITALIHTLEGSGPGPYRLVVRTSLNGCGCVNYMSSGQ